VKILSNRPICLYIAMRLSIYSDSFTCGDYLLKIPRLVSHIKEISLDKVHSYRLYSILFAK